MAKVINGYKNSEGEFKVFGELRFIYPDVSLPYNGDLSSIGWEKSQIEVGEPVAEDSEEEAGE